MLLVVIVEFQCFYSFHHVSNGRRGNSKTLFSKIIYKQSDYETKKTSLIWKAIHVHWYISFFEKTFSVFLFNSYYGIFSSFGIDFWVKGVDSNLQIQKMHANIQDKTDKTISFLILLYRI